jgi:hypothetical protein
MVLKTEKEMGRADVILIAFAFVLVTQMSVQDATRPTGKHTKLLRVVNCHKSLRFICSCSCNNDICEKVGKCVKI